MEWFSGSCPGKCHLTHGNEEDEAKWRDRNAPYAFGVRAVATAIATGNTTILKSSEMTPRCYWALGRVFHDAGVPAGVVNVMCCRQTDASAVVNAMIEHPAVKKINFTGSARVGRKIAQHCSLHLKPTLLELGGKNSAIIFPDADLQKAAQHCLIGAFANVRCRKSIGAYAYSNRQARSVCRPT